MAEQDFSVTASDFNTRDRLYVRWVSDYPPYLQASSKLLESKETTPSTIPTATYQVPTDCANFKPVPQPYHRLVVIISDRRFMDPDLAENSEYRFNATEEKTYPLMLSWTVTCPQ